MGPTNFNHISKSLSEEKEEELRKLYAYYHKQSTCYRWKYKRLKKMKLILNMVGLSLITTGTIVGCVTINPIILGVVTGAGAMVQGYMAKSNIQKRVANCKFAFSNYQKILIQLKMFLRGAECDDAIFLSDVKVIEDMVVDMCPPIDGLHAKYDKIYGKL